MKYRSKKTIVTFVLFFIIISSITYYAHALGMTGRTKKNAVNGCTCHGANPTLAVNVLINGPDSLAVGGTAEYTVTISGGPLIKAGTDIAVLNGTLNIVDATLKKLNGELTHVAPQDPVSGVVTYHFSYTAPATAGYDTIYANGNSVNNSGTNVGDQWNYAPNKPVKIFGVVPVELSTFSAIVKEDKVLLEWSTSTETNNRGFEVQRAMENSKLNNEQLWNKAGFVNGNGNSTDLKKYSFEDKNLSSGTYKYRLKQMDFNGTSKFYNLTEKVKINTPASFTISQNFPNPFNPKTIIEYSIPFESNIQFEVYNSIGQVVKQLVNESKPAGFYDVSFDGSGLPSGLYFYSISAKALDGTKEYKDVKKMILLK
ncbi:MAG: T9SS type A sorting domain-containing protein [Ignavibacteriales bacterium]|nr:T9SS type A sorting domain-containing protein [Ignavibacteriales bacterium]